MVFGKNQILWPLTVLARCIGKMPGLSLFVASCPLVPSVVVAAAVVEDVIPTVTDEKVFGR